MEHEVQANDAEGEAQVEASENAVPYVYIPISQGNDIRLLVIRPGKLGDPLVCSLPHIKFAAKPEYEALSYTWGSNDKPRIIYAPGSLPIGENLHAALQRLRLPDKPRNLWVDAVCINQESVTERNQQVQIMGTVYSTAKRVVIWLGEEAEMDAEAFKVISEFEDDNETLHSEERPTEDPAIFWRRLSSDRTQWGTLAALFRRPWFKRVWVIQEVALAATAHVICGSHTCSWHAIARLVKYVYDNQLPPILGGNHFNWVGNICVVRRALKNDLSDDDVQLLGTIDGLLFQTKIFDATIPHDKIYGLLGLRALSDQRKITVDYNLPCEKLYTQLALQRIFEGDVFRTFVDAGRSTESVLPLPSWVPDWSIGSEQPGRMTPLIPHPFKTAGDTEGSVSVSSSLEVINVDGYAFDTVKEVAQQILLEVAASSEVTDVLAPLKSTREWWEEVLEISTPVLPYPTGEEASILFPRLLVCNQGPSTSKSKENDNFHIFGFTFQMKMMYHMQDVMDNTASEELIGDIAMTMVDGQKYEAQETRMLRQRKLGSTNKRYLGWVPLRTKPDDVICIFKGADTPFVLRPLADGYYMLIGECYIHGIMEGEAVAAGGLEGQVFRIR